MLSLSCPIQKMNRGPWSERQTCGDVLWLTVNKRERQIETRERVQVPQLSGLVTALTTSLCALQGQSSLREQGDASLCTSSVSKPPLHYSHIAKELLSSYVQVVRESSFVLNSDVNVLMGQWLLRCSYIIMTQLSRLWGSGSALEGMQGSVLIDLSDAVTM